MSFPRNLILLACAGLFPVLPLAAQDISTEFNTSDGFVTGSFAPITLSSSSVPGFDATFSLGQQQQSFDGGSYVNGPAGFLFINGNFNGATGDGINDDAGVIDFSGNGASEVTFFGANRANGAAVGFEVFGVDDTTSLGQFSITQTSLSPSATQTILSEIALGGAIGRIEFDLPGPAANAPYALAIDTFTATSAAVIPEPGTAGIFLFGALAMVLRCRRAR